MKPMKLCCSSVEGAQHTPKGLDGFLEFANGADAKGCQPSNFMLEAKSGGFLPAKEIVQKFADQELVLHGVSAHCPCWVHTSAWTGTKTIRPFLPKDMLTAELDKIEQWAEDYMMRLLDLCAELGVKVVPMFWGVAFGWEIATGYPWGFWTGPDYDLVAEGCDRFVKKTQKIRDHARKLDIVLAHEIHPGTAAVCAQDFLKLVEICGGGMATELGVNADPSHCWDGESWQTRFSMPGIAERVYGCHMKNHYVKPGHPLHCMEPDWKRRPMQFTPLATGDINLLRYTELMLEIGYADRWRKLYGPVPAPLVVEAEGAFGDLDQISGEGIAYVQSTCCFDVAAGSFEDGMGAGKD
jgi:sugar phosphate isomerase/epimerase